MGRRGGKDVDGSNVRSAERGTRQQDILCGRAYQDVLLHGGPDHDANGEALVAILAEWASNKPMPARVADLADGSGGLPRLNQDSCLNGSTVGDDDESDTLNGGAGEDRLLSVDKLDAVIGP